MNFTRKTASLALILLGTAASWYQIRTIQHQRVRLALLAAAELEWRRKIQQFSQERTDAAKHLVILQKEQERLGSHDPDSLTSESAETSVKLWLSRVHQLKQRLEDHPEQKIPELRLATEEDWLEVAQREISSDADYRKALAKVRESSTEKFTNLADKALKQYSEANGGAFPSSLAQLQPYFANPADAAILQRYAIIPASQVPYIQSGDENLITQNRQVDQTYDSYIVILGHGGGASFSAQEPVSSFFNVLNAYMAANQGQLPNDPAQLVLYATSPEQQAEVQKVIQHTVRPSMILTR